MSDTVNVADDHPAIMFGPNIDGSPKDSEVPPFYLSLKIHDFILHNAMLDFGSSHNLMPKSIMDTLGLDITRPYHDLYSFDYGRVKCLSLIKDLVVSLDQILAKNVLMDVVVVDIPPRFGMLISHSLGEKLKGTLQLDFSYATIPVFEKLRKMYREKNMKFMISSKERPNNHPMHVVHTDLESFILYNDMSLVDDDSHIVEILEVINSVHKDLIIEKDKEDVDNFQPKSSLENTVE